MIEYDFIRTDVLIIGCGVTGLRAALAARGHVASVTVAAKSGGASVHYDAVNAPFGHADTRDNPDVYYQDMLNSGVYLSHRGLVKRLASEAIPSILELESLGVHFDKIDGCYVQRLVSGGSYRRAIYVNDRAGSEIIAHLREKANRQEVKFLSPITVIQLLRKGNCIVGALGIDLKKRRLLTIHAKAIVMAAGGVGHLYQFTSYPRDIIGQGIALAYRAGSELVDMEFVQFEPSGVYSPEPVKGLLVPTALFGEGGVLLNKIGERFVATTPFQSETRAHKHELSLLIAQEAEEGRSLANGGVFFDGSAIPLQVLESYPLRQKRLKAAGLDLKRDRVEVGPVAHSMIGGIRIDTCCRTSVPGLFAAGEVTGGVHGANRMAGNGGSETIVFGKIAGDSAGRYAVENDYPKLFDDDIVSEINRLDRFNDMKDIRKTEAREIQSEIQSLVAGTVGVIRNGKDMDDALQKLENIKVEKLNRLLARDLTELAQCLEAGDMALLAEIILRAGSIRCESRGAHYRSDFPEPNDEQWLKNIIIKKHADGSMEIKLREISEY